MLLEMEDEQPIKKEYESRRNIKLCKQAPIRAARYRICNPQTNQGHIVVLVVGASSDLDAVLDRHYRVGGIYLLYLIKGEEKTARLNA